MGQKVNPISLRLSYRRDWQSRWFANKKTMPLFVEEDQRIRTYLESRLRLAAVPKIFIERAGAKVRIKIFTARPGVVIGRKGQELEKLKDDVAKLINRDIMLDIQEVKKPDIVAKLVAENIALQLERRVAFRRAMKKAVQTALSMGADGIRIRCSGRLGGAEIARTEEVRSGRVPLHTIRENIDYGFTEAKTVYGIIGVKCWLCLKTGESI